MTKLILFILIIILFALGLWQIALLAAALGTGLAMVEFFEKFNPKG
jgi:cytochrome oxidase assembly protein ShyY1